MSKKSAELAIHEKDTGSSEIQIALLTEKIENLSKHIKQFKKDKHSSVGLLKAVNRRKKSSKTGRYWSGVWYRSQGLHGFSKK